MHWKAIIRKWPLPTTIVEGTQPVCDLYAGADVTQEVIERRAKLIAAIPQLLEALHDILNRIQVIQDNSEETYWTDDGYSNPNDAKLFQAGLDAIEKAIV